MTRSPAIPRWTLGLLLLTAAVPLATAAAAEDPTEELLRRYFSECLDQPGDYGCLEEYWTADKADGVRRSEAFRRSFFPDLHYEIVEILVDGDRAAVRCRVTGTYPGTAPAGDSEAAGDRGRLEIDEAFFYRLKDGKIDSGKPFSDRIAVAEALGYTVTPPGD